MRDEKLFRFLVVALCTLFPPPASAIRLHAHAANSAIPKPIGISHQQPVVKRQRVFDPIHVCLECRGGSFLRQNPFLSAVIITTCNAVVADLFTQLILERNPWNAQRSLMFASFGLIVQGCLQYTVVNVVWEKLFPGTEKKSVIAKIVAMNMLSDPLLFFPCFYIFKEAMKEGSANFGVVKAAMSQYAKNYWKDWRNSWLVWFPGHAVTYGVMPPHKRIPWIASLSFFYMSILSLTRGGTSKS